MQLGVALECLAGGLLALGAPGVASALEELEEEQGGARATVLQDEEQEAEPPPEEPPLAEPAEVERLLERYERAKSTKEARAIAEALGAMGELANPEFAKPALETLGYRATSVDKKSARAEAAALGQRGREELEHLLRERETAVQVAAARILGWHADPEVGRALQRAFTGRGLAQDKPLAAAAMVDALGRSGYVEAQEDVLDELKRRGDPELLRACVRYFGQVETTSYDAVRWLCNELAAPEPAGVDTAGNPPASYWEERWKKWQAVRRDVSWALHRITGQSFQPAESGGPGDSQRALEWVREHKRELGLR